MLPRQVQLICVDHRDRTGFERNDQGRHAKYEPFAQTGDFPEKRCRMRMLKEALRLETPVNLTISRFQFIGHNVRRDELTSRVRPICERNMRATLFERSGQEKTKADRHKVPR